jgi:hypothetical protein
MKKYFLLVFLVIFLVNVRAAVVSSCDGRYLARDDGRGHVIMERDGKVIGSGRIDHAVNGGVFALDDSMLILFGLPIKTDARYPQVTHLSVYRTKSKIRLVNREVYGGGVYVAAFSLDQKFIVVENQFGVDLINLEENKSQSFDVTYVPQFRTQKCEKR